MFFRLFYYIHTHVYCKGISEMFIGSESYLTYRNKGLFLFINY